MSPEGTDLVLATNIPYVELDVLVRDSLDVETDCKMFKSGENMT